MNILYPYFIPFSLEYFFSGGVRGQRKDRISSHLSCSECLNLCGPAFILWLTRSVFLTAESGLTFPLWVHRAVLCRDYRVGVGERSRRHREPTFILMSINQTHSLCFALACDVLQSLYWVTYVVKLHPFVVRWHKNKAFRRWSGYQLSLVLFMHVQPLWKWLLWLRS